MKNHILHRSGFKPDYKEFLTMVKGEKPSRPVLYEQYIEWPIIEEVLADKMIPQDDPPWGWCLNMANAHAAMGHDVAPLGLNHLLNFRFVDDDQHGAAESVSQNRKSLIENLDDVENFPWPDPEMLTAGTMLDDLAERLPEGMKLILHTPRSVFESLVDILGFENMSMMYYDDPEAVDAICEKVGSRIVKYIEKFIDHDIFCGMFVSDDLGHKTSTFIAPDNIINGVLPWHKEFVKATHAGNKIAILHSCGQVESLMGTVIDDCDYDAKHSFEDVICPVEDIYEQYGQRIAILGGLDLDFLARSNVVEIEKRATDLLQRSQCCRYALGTGNSITADTPCENIAALIRAVEKAEKNW